MTDRAEVARRVAERLNLTLCECADCKRREGGPRPNGVPASVWDALISAETENETLRANTRKAIDTIGDCSDSWKERAEKAEMRVEEYKDACGLEPADLEKLLDAQMAAMGIAELGDLAELAHKLEKAEARVGELEKALRAFAMTERVVLHGSMDWNARIEAEKLAEAALSEKEDTYDR